LPELAIQYGDFAVWQREWLQGERLERELSYWREQLGGELPTLELPTDRVRPATHTYRGAGEYLELSPALVENLKTLSRREGVTLYMTLLAAFNVLLARYSGQADICIGTPIAGRTRAETEELIGFFVNTLVLRADMSGNPGFREFLAQVRERSLGAYVHQDVPFERLVEELQPSRSLSHTPLFQVMFMLQNAPVGELKLQDLTLSEIDTGVSTAKYDLSLSMTESEEGLNGSLIYNTDLFDAETIQRLLRHFQTLLEAVAADPQRRLSDLSLLTGDERRQLLVEFNDTERDYPREQTIQELFEEQAARRPESLALRCDGQQMSYGELNARANQLAHYLRKRGVGPEATVGILSGRSLELVVGMLAVLKAGGAFVPLDYHHPPQRLASMLEETGARVLLTQERMRDRLPEFNGEVLSLDGEQSLFDGEPTTNPEARNPPEHLAFIYHTSGSTGRPKGVLAVHRGVVNYLAFVAGNYELSERDVVLQVASLTFDASVRDILGTLAGGAKLVLVGDEDARDPLALLRQIEAQGVTCILSIVPTLLRSLVETAAEGVRPGATLRLILASGENLLFSECERARSVFGPQLSLVNQYGATECTMSQTFHRVRETEAQGVVPAGRPISNTQVFILDGRLEPCPVGVAGEVHIGGAGLARGYLRSPELTALKYIPHPHAREAGARLYKTGDRARYLPDGRIELLGRLDQQLKVRGMRIEPGEIEGALGAHENVRACVVVAREDAPGDQRLVAYVVLRRTQEGEGLRAHLKERLPAHMLPSAFVVLDALPLTSNGKIDRAALPAPDRSANESAPSFVAPRTPLEESLCGIWAEILGVGRVGVEDNFFELGGHSLLATQVMSRIRKTLQIELPLRALFEQPTVASLAVLLEPGARSELSEMEKIAQILRQVNELSPDEARALLVNRKS
jgi:pristinamycin I synthase-3/4